MVQPKRHLYLMAQTFLSGKSGWEPTSLGADVWEIVETRYKKPTVVVTEYDKL